MSWGEYSDSQHRDKIFMIPRKVAMRRGESSFQVRPAALPSEVFFFFFFYTLVGIWRRECVYQSARVEVTGQPLGINFLLPPTGTQRLDSGPRAREQAPFPI